MFENIKFYSEYQGYKLTYHLTYTRNANSFGVGVTSSKDGQTKSAQCYNLTTQKSEALDFLSFLLKTSTFPTTLNDMVEDWIFDKNN
ncbi:MAG: DUF6514 family protein [Acutalibacteraceae bacterium]|jgi:hypothetical protein|nr:hypothetical protein [Clostridiales bacterium]